MSAEGEVEVLQWGHGLGAVVAVPRHATRYEMYKKPVADSTSLIHPKGQTGEAAAEQRVQPSKAGGGLRGFINGFLGR
jgi:hypothetical protein